MSKITHVRHLIVVLGDQLNSDSSAFKGFDPKHDCVWMAEVHEESTHIWSSKQRIALFISAMRHFAKELEKAKVPCTTVPWKILTTPSRLMGNYSAPLRRSNHKPS